MYNTDNRVRQFIPKVDINSSLPKMKVSYLPTRMAM